MRDTVVIGNIITMDPRRPRARAALVKGGTFAYIGDEATALGLAGEGAEVLDYGEDFVYPGFLEAHTHGYMAGERAVGQAKLADVIPTDYARYAEIIREFIAANPDREVYVAAGWEENDEHVDKAYLDGICADKPLMMQTGGGHSMLLNTCALRWAGIDAAYAGEMGPDQVHVDENGEPDGYICEKPVVDLMPKLPTTFEDAKRYLLAWQDIALSCGLTAVTDAAVELSYRDCARAYHELDEEGKLRLRTFGYLLAPENVADAKAEVARIAADRARYGGEHFQVVGVKVFLDGVMEAHTAWQIADYADAPGYHGLERFNDHDRMVELICEADREGLSVHGHSIGDGATRFMLGCIEEAEAITGDMDQRNVLAHLQFVADEEFGRMGETRTIAAVAPLWTPKEEGDYEMSVAYVGQEMADAAYPIKSFVDAGASVVFHSDYPVSADMGVARSVYMAEVRALPEESRGGMATQRNAGEAINREQALAAMTINVARQWRQEDRMGSIEYGKLANMTVLDCDLIHDDLQKIVDAQVVATIVDGEEVYRA